MFYAKGLSNATIEEWLQEMHDFRLPTSTISTITARVSEDVIAWQHRPLPSINYPNQYPTSDQECQKIIYTAPTKQVDEEELKQ